MAEKVHLSDAGQGGIWKDTSRICVFFFFLLMERRVFCILLVFVGCTPEHTEPSVTEEVLLAVFLARRPGTFGGCFSAMVHLYEAKILPFLLYVCALRKVFTAVFLAYSCFLSSVEIQEYRAAPLSCGTQHNLQSSKIP